jgi:hypothetical protein
MGWIGGTHSMRYHAQHHTSGMGQNPTSGTERFEEVLTKLLLEKRRFSLQGINGLMRRPKQRCRSVLTTLFWSN